MYCRIARSAATTRVGTLLTVRSLLRICDHAGYPLGWLLHLSQHAQVLQQDLKAHEDQYNSTQ